MITPQARTLVSIALGFALVAGYLARVGSYVMAVVARVHDLSGRSLGVGESIVTILIGVGVLWMATDAGRQLSGTWERATAQAAQLLAVAGIAIALLGLLAAVAAHDGGRGFIGFPIS
ncbi:MAG: hypothetical protein JWR52_2098 [Marmoricola sp.]|nr:hypothetical protein [Marmoricola sp.]